MLWQRENSNQELHLLTHILWDGKELKPKSGAKFENTWVFDGREWKLKSGAKFSNTWIVNGNIPVLVCALVILGLI